MCDVWIVKRMRFQETDRKTNGQTLLLICVVTNTIFFVENTTGQPDECSQRENKVNDNNEKLDHPYL